MCLSKPTTTTNNNTNSNNNNNNGRADSATCSSKCSMTSCNDAADAPNNDIADNCNQLKLRKNIPKATTDANYKINTTKTTVTETTTSFKQQQQQPTTTSKDLLLLGDSDLLGYKEENAVYKEIPHSQQQQQCAVENDLKNSNSNATTTTTATTTDYNENYDIGYKPQIRWPDLGAQLFLHIGGLYGFYLLFSAKFYTFLWVVITIWASGIGITAGAHRLWSHKSYTASLPLRIFLMFLFTIAGQRDAYTWALDHRIHHKFSETEADPHNAKRGFFFAHVGWLFITAHPKVEEKRKVIDMSDLENDAIVMFQRKWFIPLFALCSIAFPVLMPCYLWQESLWSSFWINFNMRFCSTLNIAFFVNSVAHLYGRKPYDKNISPSESPVVSFLALGEGWHNYHHVFPWDYKTSEFGNYSLNVTTAFIDFCARFGLAKGRKSVSPDMVTRRAAKCGDGTRFLSDEFAHKDQVWGYGDRDMPKEDAEELAKMK